MSEPNDRRESWRNGVARRSEDDPQAEQERLRLAIEINSRDTAGPELDPIEFRKRLEAEHGQVWNSYELARDFEIIGFADPLVAVRRKMDGALGTLIFQHEPRFYWSFEADKAPSEG
jgi:hypothetical protein